MWFLLSFSCWPPMRPLRGQNKAAASRGDAHRASERPRLPKGNGLGSLPGTAAALDPGLQRSRWPDTKEGKERGRRENRGESSNQSEKWRWLTSAVIHECCGGWSVAGTQS